MYPGTICLFARMISKIYDHRYIGTGPIPKCCRATVTVIAVLGVIPSDSSLQLIILCCSRVVVVLLHLGTDGSIASTGAACLPLGKKKAEVARKNGVFISAAH